MRDDQRDQDPGLSPEARRLLSMANPVRPMNALERMRALAFIEELSPCRAGMWYFAWRHLLLATMMAGAGIAFFVHQMQRHDVIVEPEPIPPDSNTPRPTPSLARIPDPSYSIATAAAMGVNPTLGDVCGQRVCESMPSCCEGAWTEACDEELLYWTRSAGFLSSHDNVGRCYWHDREICPGCACPIYLKQVTERNTGDATLVSVGYDGGTGCLKSQSKLLVELKWMCVQGYCEE